MQKPENIDFIDAIDIHLSQLIGEDEVIELYDNDLETEPVDLLWIKPNAYRPYVILMTCGISAKPMRIPADTKGRFAELVMLLPPDANIADHESKDEAKRWPFDHLRQIGHIVLSSNSYISFGKVFNYDEDDNFCFPGTNFNSSVILNSKTLPEAFVKIKFNAEIIHLFTVTPLYLQEFLYLEQHNVNMLLDRFNESQISEVLDTNRLVTC